MHKTGGHTVAIELWDERTANLIDDFASEAEALQELRAIILRDGEQAIRAWALDRYDGKPMIRGSELVALALRAIPA